MGAIYLLRHGKASFGAEDYDQLDPVGLQQARLLGEALAMCALRKPLFFSGDMRRHRQTLKSCHEALGSEMACQIDPRWNEFDHQQIIEAAASAKLAQLRSAMAQEPDPHAAFQRLIEKAMMRWTAGAHDADYAETWPAFHSRVGDALAAVVEAMRSGQDVVVSTSGGPIAAIVQRLLSIPDAQAVTLNWAIANASYTKLISGRQLRLACFNVHAHLEQTEPKLVTYR